MGIASFLFRPTHFKRGLFFFLSDVIIVCLALYGAFFVRFEFSVPRQYLGMMVAVLPLFMVVKLLAFYSLRIYRITWRYVGLTDLFKMVTALLLSEAVLAALILWMQASHTLFVGQIVNGFPRSIFLLDAILSAFFLPLIRLSKRVMLEVIRKTHPQRDSLRTFIIGAGNTGELIIREMAKYGYAKFYPLGFLDDNDAKVGTYIHGVKVLGNIDDMSRLISVYKPQAIIIAIPTLNFKRLRKMYDLAKKSGIETVKIIPRIYDYHKPQLNLKSLEDISIEDLIGRETVSVDCTEIGELLKGKSILVTGAGGSIGSEIVMQVCGFEPRKVVLFDMDETALFNMENKLKRAYPESTGDFHMVVGNILDEARLESVFERMNPDIVFHAAAYKHVPMMEFNPTEAVRTNIFGTYNIARVSTRYHVQKFIMISTDKAVRPTSIMGATKRVAENICAAFNNGMTERRMGKTEFISVRFGNVLGSRGSVLPLFMDQLKRGGPLTITHKDMMRFFMTIPEAVTLVLQASFIGKGGDVLVLDMGDPIKIVDLAEELIRLHGLQPYKDIGIEFIGLRPGEKLFEEILTAEEGTTATKHEKIYVARKNEVMHPEDIELLIDDFNSCISSDGEEAGMRIKKLLKHYVKHFEGKLIGD